VRYRLADAPGDLIQRHRGRLAGGAVADPGVARGQAAPADRDPERDAGGCGVAELHARPHRAVVDDRVHARVEQPPVHLPAHPGDGGIVLLPGHHDRLERRDRGGHTIPLHWETSMIVAAGAHDRLDGLAVRPGHRQTHRACQLPAESPRPGSDPPHA
jgi:hypothetical protein